MLDDTQRAARSSEEPAELFERDHASTRKLCADALAIAEKEKEDADASRIAAASARVARFFAVELPKHEEDEEEVLGRVLIAHDPTVAPAMGLVMTQHAMLRGACHDLVPLWTAVAEDPRKLVEIRRKLASSTRRLVEMLDVHHELEETLILPRIATLSDLDRRTLFTHMLDRLAAR